MKTPKAIQLSFDVEQVLQGPVPLLGDSLAVRLILALAEDARRFGELQSIAGKASSKTLSARLKDLERHGLVTKTIYAEVPPRVVYALTSKGHELVSHILALAEWEHSWRQQ